MRIENGIVHDGAGSVIGFVTLNSQEFETLAHMRGMIHIPSLCALCKKESA